MARARIWFVRIALAYAALTFGFLASIYFFDPLAGLDRFGVTLSGEPHSITFVRTSLGAMFAGFAITAAYALARPAHILACLWFIVIMNGCIVAARLYGFAADGITPMQWTELRDEGLSFALFVAALIAGVRHFAQKPTWSRA